VFEFYGLGVCLESCGEWGYSEVER